MSEAACAVALANTNIRICTSGLVFCMVGKWNPALGKGLGIEAHPSAPLLLLSIGLGQSSAPEPVVFIPWVWFVGEIISGIAETPLIRALESAHMWTDEASRDARPAIFGRTVMYSHTCCSSCTRGLRTPVTLCSVENVAPSHQMPSHQILIYLGYLMG